MSTHRARATVFLHLIAWLAAGVIIGSSAAQWFVSRSATNSDAPLFTDSPQFSASEGNIPAHPIRNADFTPEAAGILGERLHILVSVAAHTEPEPLETAIAELAFRSASSRRTFELEALLLRLAEMDPRRSLSATQRWSLEARFVALVLRAWAAVDPGSALAALAGIPDTAVRRTAAVAMLDAIGFNARNLALVAENLPAGDGHAFSIHAITELSEHDPLTAMDIALALDEHATRHAAVAAIGRVWVRRDASAALDMMEALPDTWNNALSLREVFVSAAFAEWPHIAPDAALRLLTRSDVLTYLPIFVVAQTTLVLADTIPHSVLASLDRLDPELRESARDRAVTALAEQDLNAALAVVSTMPRARDNESLLGVVARAYASHDPDAATRWVHALDPPSQLATHGLFTVLAETDPDRALDMLVTDIGNQPAGDTASPVSRLTSSLSTGALEHRLVAERLLEFDAPAYRSSLGAILSGWIAAEESTAAAWILQNLDTISVQTLAVLPERQRNDALTRETGRMACSDPSAARTIIEQYFTDAALRREAERMVGLALDGELCRP